MKAALITLVFAAVFFLSSTTAWAHCDTMEGPVVKAASAAIEQGRVDPVLRWIKPEYEGEVRAAFRQALEVRTLNTSAKELADSYFFETVVRLHRTGEGEPYTGLKPAGTPVEPIITAADEALTSGHADQLARGIAQQITDNIATRFAEAMHARREADTSIEAGRRYVAAYVEFVHYLEQLDKKAEARHTADEHQAMETPVHHH